MKAAVIESFHEPLVIKHVPLQSPGPMEITVEVMACGLCLTDIHILEGRVPTVKLPIIPGHEFAGVVVRKGALVTEVEVGWRVTVCVDVVCGRCRYCSVGETNRCLRLSRIGFEQNGGMAQFVNVPAINVERIADAVSFEKAAVIPDAVASIYRGLKTIGEVGKGTRLAIVGIGGLGMQGVKIASLLGAEITCVDLDDEKLERARALGAVRTINPRNGSLFEISKESGEGFDVVVDNVGKRQTLLQCVSACCPGGRVVAMGYVDPELEIPAYDVVIKEKQVLGSRSVSRQEFREVVELVNEGKLDPEIGELIPIAEVNSAYNDLRDGKFKARAVLTFPF